MSVPTTTVPRLSATPTFDPLLKPAIHLPKHTLLESPNSRAILVGNWRITASTNPISNAPQCDQLQSDLSTGSDGGLPLPEMTFGSNSLKMEWRTSGFIGQDRRQKRNRSRDQAGAGADKEGDTSAESDLEEAAEEEEAEWIYEFDTLHALLGVKKGYLEPGDGGVKVGYAEEWLKSRTGPSPLLPMPKTVPTKPYDWTYTTTYCGHSPSYPSVTSMDTTPSATSSASSSVTASHSPRNTSPSQWVPFDLNHPSHAKHQIPLAELTRPDPILFYAEVPLFEDELHDNGSSALIVRIRVMPTCIFILSRFTLRVDGVLFRTFDTRIYSSLENDEGTIVIRETTGWEAPYDAVKNRLPKRDDLTPLTDPLFIAKILSELPQSRTTGAGTGWRGLGKKCEWMRVRR
ncbi:MAG: type 2A phosphatase activator TIP41 [Lentinula lateritia]|uniref:TIP41-like family-domain-containing protein n=1 Tax=Lentinula lateritia TaxID=40482 RepID=A0ABQ8VMK3_9AGAR|nr:MAG: type 2A phosphatase activator TIP41 [Lentinula lateritia]KAJ4496827.1 TIP41-like family-domain-containing protein [Lentinula lateritia]